MICDVRMCTTFAVNWLSFSTKYLFNHLPQTVLTSEFAFLRQISLMAIGNKKIQGDRNLAAPRSMIIVFVSKKFAPFSAFSHVVENNKKSVIDL